MSGRRGKKAVAPSEEMGSQSQSLEVKELASESQQSQSQSQQSQSQSQQSQAESQSQSKKRTTKKKQFPVVAVITPEGIEGNLLATSRRPLVVHFPIQSKDVPMNDMPITYDPAPPTEAQPYDCLAENPFHEVSETVVVPVVEAAPPSSVAPVVVEKDETDFYRLKGMFLVQFKGASEAQALPETSEAACFWCCQSFAGRPVVLPLRDTGEHLLVTGNFCCPECACAYLFDMRQDAHSRWEQQALLHRVYGEACGGDIHPAPHRTLLKMFGGTLTVEQYRKLIRSHTVRVDIHLPPMVSILATMDTKPIDFYDASLTKNVNETVTERLHKAEEVLRLRRTKPLKAWESTLDACINLKIKYDSTALALDT
jgi:hypothetical protein